jgi:SAM-dependent methyltransferase
VRHADLPCSEACERNGPPILAVLQPVLRNARAVLELGSGTGQHAVRFAAAMPWLTWQPTEVAARIDALAERVRLEGTANLSPPQVLDVSAGDWPRRPFDAVFTANTLHIIGWSQVDALLRGAASVLVPGGVLAAYGPFRYGARHTAASNESFDRMLRERDAASGVRDALEVDDLAAGYGLLAEADHALPANNRLRLWRRPSAGQ